MLSKLTQWFEKEFKQAEVSHSLSPELAQAALFYEVIRADHVINDDELAQLREILYRCKNTPKEDVDELIANAKHEAETSLDLVKFTRVINQEYSHDEKRELLLGLWQLAFADNTLDGHEDYAIRKIADLLYLNHSDFIQTKLAAQKKT